MISIKREVISNIPCLIVVPSEKRNEVLPLVIYYHGFNGEKEASLTIAYKMALNNQRVVLPDSLYHGERQDSITQTEKELAFWEIVMQNIEDIALIRAFFLNGNLVSENKIGVAGTSMGGITTYGALTKYDWISAAAVVMGTPNMTSYAQLLIDRVNAAHPNTIPETTIKEAMKMLKPLDLSLHPEAINNRPLLAWHGEKDDVIPLSQSTEFFNDLGSNPNYRLVEEAKRMHHVSRLAVEETVAWFAKHLD